VASAESLYRISIPEELNGHEQPATPANGTPTGSEAATAYTATTDGVLTPGLSNGEPALSN
jgi:hypothetical protein